MAFETVKNAVIPLDARASTCGYCSPPGQRSQSPTSYHSATLEAISLSCSAYQAMIDRGWRRSGDYCYKPNLKLSCCPQYTIRLDAKAFEPSRSQRKLMNRWNRYVIHGESDSEGMEVDEISKKGLKSKSSGKPKKAEAFISLKKSIHDAESRFATGDPVHKFEVTLEPSSYTREKFSLYKKYQSEIHNDHRNNPDGFKGFLVKSPLGYENIPYTSSPPSHLPQKYGSYHQLYRLNGQLIAMAVLDILPKCVSSVYFMYDKAWEKFSFGKLSALRETSLASEMQETGAPNMGYLYMGFYIHSCQKMRYKGEYSPSYLCDPETYEWYPLETCKPLLEKHRYACFSDPSHSIDNLGDEVESDSEPHSTGTSVASSLSDTLDLEDIQVLVRSKTGDVISVPIKKTSYMSFEYVLQELRVCIRGLGHQLALQMAFLVSIR